MQLLTAFWTAPGDDGETGQDVLRALLRHGAAGASVSSWWNAVPYSAAGQPAPPLAAAGQLDSTTVTGLTQGTTYYFVIVARDEAANLSQYLECRHRSDAVLWRALDGPVVVGRGRTTLPASWFRGSPLRTPRRSIHSTAPSVRRRPGRWSNRSLRPRRRAGDPSVAPGTIDRYRAALAGPDIEGVRGARHRAGDRDDDGAGGSPGRGGRGSIHAYPNPDGPRAGELDVTATGSDRGEARVYDLKGQRLATVAEGAFPPAEASSPGTATGAPD